ncbi:MAG: preprotein translocase subunit SecF [candidate division Zixibacteria bacterium SM23_73_2]|nr:MAG: preprotein translocase subunit SecF [candidate division Zixibacteria bacterium SM23_73_2]
MQILPKTNINFVGIRKYGFLISLVLVIFGILAFVMIFLGKASLGIDFAGGTMIQGNFEKPISVGEIRNALSEIGYGDAEIKELTRDVSNSFMIRVKASVEEITQVGESILAKLDSVFPDNPFHKDSVDEVGPVVGKILQRQARLAVILAFLGILIYIWIRFDFRFGVAATITTFHDVLVVLGLLFIFQKEITLLVVTALLTLAGYSLTDTVVVFDRIRENLKLFRRKGDFNSIINSSINEVLSRTVITSTTTLLVVLTLFILGGEVIHDFAFALILGIIIGTYSSVFVASPIIVEWERKAPKRFK